MGRKLPITSLEANEKAVPQMREQHHAKIIAALKELKIATYEKIAEHLKMDKHQVGRRTKELELLGVIYKPGLKLNTTSGRQAFVYALTSTPVQTPTQIVDTIIHNATKPDMVQKSLF